MKRFALLLGLPLASLLVIWLSGSFDKSPDGLLGQSGMANGKETPGGELRQAPGTPVDVSLESDLQRVVATVEGTAEPKGFTGITTDRVLRVRTVDGNDRALAGLTLFLRPRDQGAVGRVFSTGITDAEGVWTVSPVPSGRVELFCSAGGSRSVRVAPAGTTNFEWELDNLLPVEGRVVDKAGAGVPGATVYVVSWRMDYLGNQPATVTGPDGVFTIPFVEKSKSLGATAPNFAPAALVDLDRVDSKAAPVVVVLTLGGPGGSLVGRVLDNGGQPIAGAQVAAGKSPEEWATYSDFSHKETWCAFAQETDGDGSFAFEGLPPGNTPLSVLAEGAPLWSGLVEVVEGQTTDETIRLNLGATVSGIVTGPDGKPVAGAIILVLPRPYRDSFPTQGPTERGKPFHIPATRSDAKGRYHLPNLDSGPIHMYASRGASAWDRGEFLGKAHETVTCEAGKEIEWNPKLSLGHYIRGRVVYADGAPMAHVFANASDGAGGRYAVDTDEEGRFLLVGLEDRPYDVRIEAWMGPAGAPPLERKGLMPSASEVLFTASFGKDTTAKAMLMARIKDPDGLVVGSNSVQFQHARGAYFSVEKDGVYSAWVPADRYCAIVENGDRIVGASEWFEVIPGQNHDFGDVLVRPAKPLRVRVVRGKSFEQVPVSVSVDVEYSRYTQTKRMAPDAGEATFENLLAGAVSVRVKGLRVATHNQTVVLDSLAERTVEVSLTAGVPGTIHVRGVGRGYDVMNLRIYDGQKNLYDRAEFWESPDQDGRHEYSFSFAPGNYRVEVSTEDGRTGAGSLFVAQGDEKATLELSVQ